SQLVSELFGLTVGRVVLVNPGRAKDGHRRPKVGQGVKSFDELAHDAQRPPGICFKEARVGVGSRSEELAVFGCLAGRTALLGHPAMRTQATPRISTR